MWLLSSNVGHCLTFPAEILSAILCLDLSIGSFISGKDRIVELTFLFGENVDWAFMNVNWKIMKICKKNK